MINITISINSNTLEISKSHIDLITAIYMVGLLDIRISFDSNRIQMFKDKKRMIFLFNPKSLERYSQRILSQPSMFILGIHILK